MKKITLKEAKNIAKKLKLNTKVYDIKWFRFGMQIELEHGSVSKITNVTKNNLLKTGKIALAHILEYPDYYQRLKKMEQKAKIFWKNKQINGLLIS